MRRNRRDRWNWTYEAPAVSAVASQLGIEDPPEVPLEREVTPDEYAGVQDTCLAESGFIRDDEGVIETAQGAETEALEIAIYSCEARFSIESRFLEPLTLDQHQQVHQYLEEEAIPCLEGLGYRLDGPPALEEYLRNVNTEVYYSTSGELFELGLTNSEVQTAIKECPEFPPADELYG